MDIEGARALLDYVEAKRLETLAKDPPPVRPTETGLAPLNRWFETLAVREAADAREAASRDPGRPA